MFNINKKSPGSILTSTSPSVENEGYPDSYRPYGLCPRCTKQSSFEIIGNLPATFDYSCIRTSFNGEAEYPTLNLVTALKCRNCNQPTIVFQEEYIGEEPKKNGFKSGTVTWRGFFWWPFSTSKVLPDVPEDINSTLQEAKTAFAAMCYRASAVMSRRTLEAITVEKGITTGSLADRIKKLKQQEVIDKNLAEWATEVRLLGNNGAHFDPINVITEKEARQIILFIEELIKFMYILPAELAKRRSSTT